MAERRERAKRWLARRLKRAQEEMDLDPVLRREGSMPLSVDFGMLERLAIESAPGYGGVQKSVMFERLGRSPASAAVELKRLEADGYARLTNPRTGQASYVATDKTYRLLAARRRRA